MEKALVVVMEVVEEKKMVVRVIKAEDAFG